MVLKFNVVSKLGLVGGVILLGSLVVGSAAMAQTNPSTEAPFIGFRPFGGGESVSGSNSRAVTNAVAGAINTQAPAPTQTTITPERPASAYPYPASGGLSFGGVSNSPTGTVERTSIGGRLPNGTIPTGGLNGVVGGTAGQAAGVVPIPNADPALWQRYQQELQQQQTQQQQQQIQQQQQQTQQQQQQAQQQYQQFQQWQYQQYQQWLAQQEQARLQRQSSTVGYRAPQAPASGTAQPTAATRASAPQGSATRASAPQGSATRATTAPRPTTSRFNQPVVQQVSSTTTGNRDSAVARAAWPTSSTTNSTSVAKQATSVANNVAKPQCCCVPQRCCVAAPAPVPAPTTPAPVFRPQAVNQAPNQAANQVPSLGPSVGSTFGGFLGQAGANYQVQPLGGQQFQTGLGVPQFRSTGTLGSGGWFSNGLFGTGAYTPLLPIVSAQGARLGQGIIGQPTAYMDGQPIRNLLRYIFP